MSRSSERCTPPPQAVGLVVNPLKPLAVADAERTQKYLEARGVRVLIPPADSHVQHAPLDEEALEGAELLVVMGGDGTLLAASRYAAPRKLPMLSVRYGGFGFLAEVEPEELDWALDKMMEGAFGLDRRMMLCSELIRGGQSIHQSFALNDVVVTRGALSRVVRVRTEAGGDLLALYVADGVIVSTPTGSTAYALSAGGPLVHPNVHVTLVTPICPHSLNARSLVLEDTVPVTMTLESVDEAMLTSDGQVGFVMVQGDTVRVTKSDLTADLVSLHPSSFYDRLQKRLRWSDRLTD